MDLKSLMLHAKFQDPRPLGSGEEDFLKDFTIYGHGGHLGHVTWIIYTRIQEYKNTRSLLRIFGPHRSNKAMV